MFSFGLCKNVQNLHAYILKFIICFKVKMVNKKKQKKKPQPNVFKHLLICFHWFSQPQAFSRMSMFVCAEICGEFLII